MKQNIRITLSALVCGLTFVAGHFSSAIAAETKTTERAVVTKAKAIVLPEFTVKDATLVDALKQLKNASVQQDPAHKGVSFMLTGPATTAMAKTKLTLDLKKVTVAEATEQLAKAAGVNVTAQDYAYVFEKPDKQ